MHYAVLFEKKALNDIAELKNREIKQPSTNWKA
jgi:hypothetical protein